MRKKRLCLVVANPITVRFFFVGQIRALAKQYELTLITNASDAGFLDEFDISIRVIPVAIERDVALWRDFKALVSLVMIFRREKFDLIHSHTPKGGLLAMLGGCLAGVPVRIHTFQGEVWITRKGIWRFILKSLDKLVAACATHLLVVSESERKYLMDQGIIAAEKSVVLANGSVCGVDTGRFQPDESARKAVRNDFGIPGDGLVVLYLGRLTIDKGVLDLARVFASLSSTIQNLHLLFVGPDEEGMQDKIRALCAGHTENVHFFGYTDKAEQYMAAADILCLPSYREGFGLVLIEAAAVGLPTIGSRIYGITDAVVESDTGLLFEAGDTVDLRDKLECLIHNPEQRRKMGESGRKRVKEYFTSERVQAALLEYYKCVLLDQSAGS